MQKHIELLKNNFPKSAKFSQWRLETSHTFKIRVRSGVVEPISIEQNQGAMLTIHSDKGAGYSATCALTEEGIKSAVQKAEAWASFGKQNYIYDFAKIKMPKVVGSYASITQQPLVLEDNQLYVELLSKICSQLKAHPKTVDSFAGIDFVAKQSTTISSNGSEYTNDQSLVFPQAYVILQDGKEIANRSFGGGGLGGQGGFEVLVNTGFDKSASKLLSDAEELLHAPDCPEGNMNLLLMPDQMLLQIHESIGHPLELDRILGDERNFAGTSFVKPEMFGKYQYGSKLLNITFDPTIENQFASYGADEEGTEAKKEFLIKDGVLLKPLGGTISYQRAGLKQTPIANARAMNWNRPAIDRMANINLEPGSTSLEEMISQTDNGVIMETNCSWSIDDSRNKFQFSCEKARLIKNGKLDKVVKNPCYRGISAEFWRSLIAVGDNKTFTAHGTPFCGKGEPNQIIHVGHASPACLFKDVMVFGGVS